ncbi:MAG: prepilin-type N-terminal cleavage/methylation domain-containing protein [Planctomycetes bacterium]|nr:prepilin-type N-terminal cleavage/methylation domain-containing protein [Planctomycetota bacterium]
MNRVVVTNRDRVPARGFTLIELLVVISIIALLIGILLPALIHARELGRTSVCAAHQNQIGIALNMYVADNKDYMPREGSTHVPSVNRYHHPWPRLLIKYVYKLPEPNMSNPDHRDWDSGVNKVHYFDNAEVFRDPSHPNKKHPVQYVVNGIMLTDQGRQYQNGRHPTCQITEFMRPADAMYLTAFADDADDSIFNQQQGYWRGIDDWYDVFMEVHINGPEENSNNWGGNVARIKSDRHGAVGSNALFADSHVELRQRDTLKELESWDDRTHNYWW